MPVKKMLKIKYLFFILFLLSPSAIQAANKEIGQKDLIVLFTHDLHSNLEDYPIPSKGKTISVGGYARLATAIKKQTRGKEADCLLVDAGDFTMGTLIHTLRSKYSVELITMGMLGYDFVTFGNHDFEYGPEQLALSLITAKNNNLGKIPAIVSANTVLDSRLPELKSLRKAYSNYPVRPYRIINRAGLKIGVFGLIGKDATSDVPQAKPVIFKDCLQTAGKIVDYLRNSEKVDLVICLSHAGTWDNKKISEDEILASSVKGIDLIVSGHTHTVLKKYLKVGDTYIVSAGSYGQYLGRIEITKEKNNKFKAVNYRLIPIDYSLVKDHQINELIKSFTKKVDEEYLSLFNYEYGQALAISNFALTTPHWRDDPNKPILSGLGDFVTDSFIYAVKKVEGSNYKDISFVYEPFGYIRVPLAKGIITVNDVFRLLSLGIGLDGKAGYPLITFWLTGKEIKSLLEIETTIVPFKSDARAQIKGLKFAYDPKLEPFNRVKIVEVETKDKTFVPLEEERLYRVCTNLGMVFMAGYVKDISGGKINFFLKDENGKEITDISTLRVIFDKNKGVELKEWLAVAMYLQSFPKNSRDKLPVIEQKYRESEKKITILK